MKRFLMMLMVALLSVGVATDVNAQGFLKKLGKTAEKAAKRAVERNVERKTEKAVDDVFDGKPLKGKNNGNQNHGDNGNYNNNTNQGQGNDGGSAGAQEAPQKGQSLEMTYAKSDFVPGDEIIFEDLVDGEQIGEFPSMWDVKEGTVEVASLNGQKVITFDPSRYATIIPLMKDMKNYLPEKFTLEMDLWMTPHQTEDTYHYYFYFYDTNGYTQILDSEISGYDGDIDWSYKTPDGESRRGKFVTKDFIKTTGWHHLAISFNKRACKIYLDGHRMANIPNMKQPASFAVQFKNSYGGKHNYLKNVRLAKGAVPLYDRMMTDGKFITYGITFDVGKATIKPESMGEINRIVTLMKENPDLKFSVEGHTDSTGNAASNQTLSEKRSQAIVAKLVEMGIASDRLTAVGKGQNSPIADNSTDEGRAKNRRVEFVKTN